MNTTINTFPPFHAFNSSRSWILAIIVLLHAGFFWALTNGLSVGGVQVIPRGTLVIPLPATPKPPPPVTRTYDPVVTTTIYVPKPPMPQLPREELSQRMPRQATDVPPPTGERVTRAAPDPVIVQPGIDARTGLSEPVYPTSEIRMQHTGTVLLSVQVLENGRVGAVRIDRSSGYPRLDESALREARRWHFIPGTRDGVPVAMWKQIPITFRLKN